ncbi:MAG TPA: hypothetical protein VGJ15_06260 [Pirellulales bacterium]|jgi:hypothetical protein
MKSPDDNSMVAAIHESGHAALAFIQGVAVDSITVNAGVGETNLGGNVHMRFAKEDDWRHANTKIAIAGTISESFYLRCQKMRLAEAAAMPPAEFFQWLRLAHPLERTVDTRRVAMFCRQFSKTPRETEAKAHQLFIEVHSAITDPHVWPTIENLAVELASRRATRGFRRMSSKHLEPFRRQIENAFNFGPLA